MWKPSSTSVIRRMTSYFPARIRENSRLLSSSSSSALHEGSAASPSLSPDAVHMTESCVRRMKELRASEESSHEKMLRLSVETGGCSGFQYVFDLDESTNSDDRIFVKDGVKLVVDNISHDFVKGATVDYVEELIRSAFQEIPCESASLEFTLLNRIPTLPLTSKDWLNHEACLFCNYLDLAFTATSECVGMT